MDDAARAIDQEKERHRMTLEALADVDAGRLIDHKDILAWVDSLATNNSLPPRFRRQ